jgi:hypothetical protein
LTIVHEVDTASVGIARDRLLVMHNGFIDVDLSGESLVCPTTPLVQASIPRALSASCWLWRC